MRLVLIYQSKKLLKITPKVLRRRMLILEATLKKFGFNRVQGSLYITENEDMALITKAMVSLKKLSWFSLSIRDIRAFKVEQWSDFNSFFKEDF